jgi:hypothetical protein
LAYVASVSRLDSGLELRFRRRKVDAKRDVYVPVKPAQKCLRRSKRRLVRLGPSMRTDMPACLALVRRTFIRLVRRHHAITNVISWT